MKLTQIKSNIGFCGEGKNRVPGEKPLRFRVESQQTQPTNEAESGNQTWATLVGGD